MPGKRGVEEGHRGSQERRRVQKGWLQEKGERGGEGGEGMYNLTLNITSMVEEAKGSALMKDSLRGTVLEVKKEQDWRGWGEGEREMEGRHINHSITVDAVLHAPLHATPPHLNVYATNEQSWVQR